MNDYVDTRDFYKVKHQLNHDDIIKIKTMKTINFNKMKEERDQWARMYLACNEREQALAQRCDRLRGLLDNILEDDDETVMYGAMEHAREVLAKIRKQEAEQ